MDKKHDDEFEKTQRHPLKKYMTYVGYFSVLLSNGKVLAFGSIIEETEEFYVLAQIPSPRPALIKGALRSTFNGKVCHVAKRHVVAFEEIDQT